MKKVLFVAPHADDETLGCGGTLLKHIKDGDQVYWLIVTNMSESSGYSFDQVKKRKSEIKKVAELYGFKDYIQFDFPPAGLDQINTSELITSISSAIKKIEPQVIYTVSKEDVHTDHAIVFDAVMSSSKAFRAPYIEKILVTEILSETDFDVSPNNRGFRPNVFVNIENFLEEKIRIMSTYESEFGQFPFPRSKEAIVSQATLRGVQAGWKFAESFVLIKEKID